MGMNERIRSEAPGYPWEYEEGGCFFDCVQTKLNLRINTENSIIKNNISE